MTSDAVKSLRIDRATRGPDRRGRGGGARWCAVVCCAGVRASSANNEIRGQVFTDSERNDLPQTDDTSIPDRRACQPRLPEQSADLFETEQPQQHVQLQKRRFHSALYQSVHARLFFRI